jgi:hypothetical protein
MKISRQRLKMRKVTTQNRPESRIQARAVADPAVGVTTFGGLETYEPKVAIRVTLNPVSWGGWDTLLHGNGPAADFVSYSSSCLQLD